MNDKINPFQQNYNLFRDALSQYDKVNAVRIAMELMQAPDFEIVDFYTEVLAKSLNEIAANDKVQEIDIWEEHLRSEVIRTILELCYPYVLSQIDRSTNPIGKAIILCLEEEYHELGARMVSDYLTLLGFESYFIGANTPKHEIFSAVATLKPVLISISVTNFYHLVKLQHLIEELRASFGARPYIAVGGYAVEHSPQVHTLIKPDFFSYSFADLAKIKAAIL